jgi:hypothetical protein
LQPVLFATFPHLRINSHCTTTPGLKLTKDSE